MGSFGTKYTGSEPPPLPMLTAKAHPRQSWELSDVEGSEQPSEGRSSPAAGSSQPPPTTPAEPMAPPPVPKQKRPRKGPQEKQLKMPSAVSAVPFAAKPEEEKVIRAKYKGFDEMGLSSCMTPLVHIYITRAGKTLQNYRLPSYAHSEPLGEPTWAENTERRLEAHSTDFWLALFKIYAPDLHLEAKENDLKLPEHDPELPPNFFGHPKHPDIDEIQNQRRRLLFEWSRQRVNLRSMAFSPEKDIMVINGHLLTVTPPELMFLFFFIVV